MKPYYIKILLKGLPKTMNQINRRHWAYKTAEARKWKESVCLAIGSNIPREPLRRARVRCTRHSSATPDYDGLVSTFKNCIDGLIDAKVIIDDAMPFIGMPEFIWRKTKRGEGYVELEVFDETLKV